MNPDSSIKTKLALDSAPLFYAWPLALTPGPFGFIIVLFGLLGRLLASEAQTMQHAAYMIVVVLNLEPLPDNFGNARSCP